MSVTLISAVVRLVHEHHVGITREAELTSAEPTHRHDKEGGGQRATPASFDGACRDLDAAHDRGCGHTGQRHTRLVDRCYVEQLGDGSAEQLSTTESTDGGDRDLRLIVTSSSGERFCHEGVTSTRLELGIIGQDLDRIRCAQKQARCITT